MILVSTSLAGKLKLKRDPQPIGTGSVRTQAHHAAAAAAAESPGSLWLGAASLAELSSDLRARNVDDILTIVVNEQASAVSTGNTKTQRTSSANAGLSLRLLHRPSPAQWLI